MTHADGAHREASQWQADREAWLSSIRALRQVRVTS